MSEYYVLEGPQIVGNKFGYYGTEIVAGQYIVAKDGEYSDGGHGPISADGVLYCDEQRAKAACDKLNSPPAGKNWQIANINAIRGYTDLCYPDFWAVVKTSESPSENSGGFVGWSVYETKEAAEYALKASGMPSCYTGATPI